MECFLVGGAVRDALLGRAVTERDWVVVGATVSDMLQQGYRQVGRDFPVFLHPRSHEEYALARTERKTAAGHVGFVVHADGAVSLEDDLRRRDLTINALAQNATGDIIDPYGGQHDLQARVLRHVSTAFVEDPLRVLRVARFAAQLSPYGFVIAPETMALMQSMAAAGELAALSAERVWAELMKAMSSAEPWQFFVALRDAHALTPWFIELIDSHAALTALRECCAVTDNSGLRFVAMLAALPAARAQDVVQRLRAPSDVQQLGQLAARHGDALADWHKLNDADLLGLLERCDALRRSTRFADLCRVVGAVRHHDLATLVHLTKQVGATQLTLAQPQTNEKLSGAAVGIRVREQRIAALARLRAGGDAPSTD